MYADNAPPVPVDDGLLLDDGLPPHAAVSRAAAAMTVMTAATRIRRGQGCRGPGPRPGLLFISYLHAAGYVTVSSWQPAFRPAAAGAPRAGGNAGPSLEGYAGGSRGDSVQVCWTACDAGRGGYRAGWSPPTFLSRSPSWCWSRRSCSASRYPSW